MLLQLALCFLPATTAGGRAYLLGGPGAGQAVTYLGVTLLAVAGYGAVFLALGMLVKNPMIPAAVILGWEWINFLLPAALKKLSVIHYLQSLCPAPVSSRVRDEALAIAREALERFDVVGVLCVELFLLADGALLVNELAPRPHNSGHLTLDAHVCCQFEQQVRAVCGLPLGSTERKVPAAAMVNLLGDCWSEGPPDFAAALADPGVRLHLYGKQEARPGRKMGHLTVTDTTPESAERRALAARAALGQPTGGAV